jgi:4-hydroxy-3-polyprenylbenzoate decarboxylase
MKGQHLVVAMTGATGAGYGVELLKALSRRRKEGMEVSLVLSEGAVRIIEKETDTSLEGLRALADRTVMAGTMDDRLASGSNHFDAMVICPCTVSTAAKVRGSIADNLITRTAAVALKERRLLVIVVRETPLSTPALQALADLSSYGAVVMPASPPFYGIDGPTGNDLQRIFAGRVLDILGIENGISTRYTPGEEGV